MTVRHHLRALKSIQNNLLVILSIDKFRWKVQSRLYIGIDQTFTTTYKAPLTVCYSLPGKKNIFLVVKIVPRLVEGIFVHGVTKRILGGVLQLRGYRPHHAVLGSVSVMNIDIQNRDLSYPVVLVLVDRIGSANGNVVEDTKPASVILLFVVVVNLSQGAGMVPGRAHSAKRILYLSHNSILS